VDIDVPCDDGNACTINDQCSQGECVPGPALNCDDGNPCTVDSCNPATGCAHGNSNDACDDGNACTTGDHCEAGKCGYAGLTSCDDANVCTTDSCDPKQGCLHLLNTAPCDDKDVCTTGDHCHLGECISSGTLSCNDGNDCTDDSCSPLTGCLFVHNDLPCDDGDVCTTDDHCSGGSCQGGPPPDCADENPCTDDFCTPGAGCGHTFNTLPCSDGNACTLGEACANGVCTGGVAPDCDDDNLCTDDSCDPGQGCVNAPNLLPCSDGSVCTVNDQCADGSCQPGAPLDCDDGVPCTVDACNPAEGCVHGASNQACDDGNECTLDICHAVNGCSNPPVADNTPCGQAGWKCIGGVCKEKLPCDGGWAYKGRCWYEGPVMGTNNCPTCDTICANHGGCHEPSLVTEGWDQSCTLCKSTACPGCGCQDGEGNVAAHEAAPMHNGSVCEYTDHPNYPPICGMHYCNSSVYGRRRLCACNETP
jgi:hypothetical protein